MPVAAWAPTLLRLRRPSATQSSRPAANPILSEMLSVMRTTCWSSSSTSPIQTTPRRQSRPPSIALAASTVLVNNAASFYAGYFEELTPEQMERQLTTSLVGPMNVTRAVLPVMRKQRSGHIVTISSSAGLVGFEFCTAYAASKFGVEGWVESLQAEVAPFGITTTIVNPGFFRTELLTEQSTNYAEPSIEDYDERRAQQLAFWKAQNGLQSGDPTKFARALMTIIDQEQPPLRFIAGADAIATAEQVVATLQAQIDAFRDLSTSLAFDEAEGAGSAN